MAAKAVKGIKLDSQHGTLFTPLDGVLALTEGVQKTVKLTLKKEGGKFKIAVA